MSGGGGKHFNPLSYANYNSPYGVHALQNGRNAEGERQMAMQSQIAWRAHHRPNKVCGYCGRDGDQQCCEGCGAPK
jgi:hypothetical protein